RWGLPTPSTPAPSCCCPAACSKSSSRQPSPVSAGASSNSMREGARKTTSPGSEPAGSDGETERAHHVAPVVRDLLGTPRRHPHPVDAEALNDPIKCGRDVALDDVGERTARRRQGHADDERVVVVVPAEVVD